MLRKFLRNEGGNYAIMTAFAMVPIMGALALAIDYTQMSRHRQATLNALDAASVATAWRYLEGDSSSEQLKIYARDFFDANLGPVDPQDTTLHVLLPDETASGETLEMSAELDYQPIFYPVFQALRGEDSADTKFELHASNALRLKNTLEVALVLDNSGSMDENGAGSGDRRLDLLKQAAKELVETMADQGRQMKQVQKPVQFGIVPFAASVNVGPDNEGAEWLDMTGLSPVHHENFAWETMEAANDDKRVERTGGVYYKRGDDWGAEEDDIVTRFTLFDELAAVNSQAAWAGCVEMRPHPYSLQDEPADIDDPETLFVPMFAPDETDQGSYFRDAYNDWLDDVTDDDDDRDRQEYMPKYFDTDYFWIPGSPLRGPNHSCTTEPITPLTDVTTSLGLDSIKDAIDDMRADGATNVPQGTAWGWRVVTGRAPFTEGRPDNQKGNDKVVIVLTDGANTYYTPGSLGAEDGADNESTYSAYGYARNGRIFEGTDVGSWNFSNDAYTRAMNQQFDELCNNAKNEDIILMTVALDLSTRNNDESDQIEALKQCASDSRFRKDPEDPSKPAKLFWNTTGEDLNQTFREIADELSNLRFVS